MGGVELLVKVRLVVIALVPVIRSVRIVSWVHGSHVLREVSDLERFRVLAAVVPSVLGHPIRTATPTAPVSSMTRVVVRLHDDTGLLKALRHTPAWVVSLVLYRPLPLAALHKTI